MKKSVVAALAALFVFPACDKVDMPLQDYTPPKIQRRKVLLEDYTGHTCGNCPGAAEVAQNLEKKYEGELVVIAVHAGHFADIKKPKYLASYKTPEGEAWNDYFKLPGNPNGIINRKNFGSGLIAAFTNWTSAVDVAFKDPFILDLDIFPTYSESSRLLDVDVKAKFKQPYEKNIGVSVVMLEDSIVGMQLDYRNEQGKQDVKDYVFMHVLRGSVNGTWGSNLTSGAMAANDSLIVSFKDFSVDSAFNAKHMSVVAFAFDEKSREVLEVEKVKMIGSKNKSSE